MGTSERAFEVLPALFGRINKARKRARERASELLLLVLHGAKRLHFLAWQAVNKDGLRFAQ